MVVVVDMLSFLADRDCQPCMSRVYRGRFPALIQSRERFCEDWILFCESPPQTRLSRGAALFRVHPSPRCSATFCARLFMVMHCLSGARIERAATKTSWSLSLLSPVLFARAAGRTETFFAFVASLLRARTARSIARLNLSGSSPTNSPVQPVTSISCPLPRIVFVVKSGGLIGLTRKNASSSESRSLFTPPPSPACPGSPPIPA